MLQQLGPYKIERLVGRGGMGSVYAGTHVETGERAAIKVLAITLAEDPNFRARFLAEIETLKQLRHPHIVQMIGDGEEEGHLFYVMELVEGCSLQEALQAGRAFSWRDVVRIAIEICGALKHAHDCGVIHRDLKPANLLQLADGHVKLTDFGIAKLFGATHRTADGSVVGTADYMAPEQADGRGVTHRTDLYSLGAVMFTLLARRPPFAGGSLPQVVHKLKYEEAPSVRRYAPDTPEELDQLIAELLLKDPQQRPLTALVLANRLRSMEHALLSRGVSPHRPDQATTRVPGVRPSVGPSIAGDGPIAGDQAAGDQATRPSLPHGQPRTQLSPTMADREPEDSRGQYSWNDATVGTSPVVRDGDDREANSAKAQDAPVPSTERRSRFTTLHEHRQLAEIAGQDQGQSDSDHRSLWLLASGLVLVVGLAAWSMWPPSADTVYARIQRTVSASEPADAIQDIETFLRRFPTDSRRGEVDGWRLDVECQWLASRLALRKRKSDGLGLEPFEQRWLAAYHLREKDPITARREFTALVAEFEHASQPPPTLATVLSAAAHQARRLSKYTDQGNPP